MKTVYKIVSPLFCILLFPVFYFFPLFRVELKSSLSENLMATLGLKENLSINDFVSLMTGEKKVSASFIKSIFSVLSDENSEIGKIFTNRNWLYASVILLLLTLVISLVVAGFSIFSKKYFLITGLTVGAFATLFASYKTFEAFAAPMLSGEIGIGSLVSSAISNSGNASSAGLLSGFLGGVIRLNILQPGIAFTAAMFILGILLILDICCIFDSKYAKN